MTCFQVCARFLGHLLLISLSIRGSRSELCDQRLCYEVSNRIVMNTIDDAQRVCQNSWQLLTVMDANVQASVKKFFVDNYAQFDWNGFSSVPLNLLVRSNGRVIQMNQAIDAIYTNWKEGNPISLQSNPDTCVFFTPENSELWWNTLCSSKNVTVICMRDVRTPTNTIRNFPTPSISAISTPSTHIDAFSVKSTSTTVVTPLLQPTNFTSSSTTSSSTTVTTSSKNLSNYTASTATSTTTSKTTSSLITTNHQISSVSTPLYNSVPTYDGENNVSNEVSNNKNDILSDGYIQKLKIGLSTSIVGLIFVISIIITALLCRKFCRKQSKFSKVTDVDHSRYVAKQSEVEADKQSADSGFVVMDATNSDPPTPPYATDATIDFQYPPNNSEHPEEESLDCAGELSLSTEEGKVPSELEQNSVNKTTNKRPVKKVTFNLDNVIEIPD